MYLKSSLLACLLTFVLLSCTSSLCAINYYSDPVSGSMSNNGSSIAPWGSLSSIFAANKAFTAGDTIFLRSGEHGYAIIRGLHTGYVVIMPQPGETPVISRIRISSSATLMAYSGLKVQVQISALLSMPFQAVRQLRTQPVFWSL